MTRSKDNYSDYVNDSNAMNRYIEYQKKHRLNIRDSDKKLIKILKENINSTEKLNILDVGCSTGNLLYFLKEEFRNSTLKGCDLNIESIESCKKDDQLSGINFSVKDILNLQIESEYDVLIANAVAVYFSWEEYLTSLKSVYRALKPNGVYIAFEWIHPFDVQDIKIVETSKKNPNGLTFNFRPEKKVKKFATLAGFKDITFTPFSISKELPCQGYSEDIFTYTRKEDDGNFMSFRGALYQPWCHFVAKK